MQLKTILFLTVLFAFGTTSAQTLKSIDVTFQPELSYRTLNTRDARAKKLRNQKDLPDLGYRYGLIYNQFSRDGRRAFRTGMTYSTSGYKNAQGETTESTSWKAIEVPVTMRFYAGERACATYMDVGMGLHYRHAPDLRQSERGMASVNVGFGFVWAFDNNYGIAGGIPIRYSLTPFQSDGAMMENLISAGFELGVRRYFK